VEASDENRLESSGFGKCKKTTNISIPTSNTSTTNIPTPAKPISEEEFIDMFLSNPNTSTNTKTSKAKTKENSETSKNKTNIKYIKVLTKLTNLLN
jgi:hypothetical protein